MDTKRAAFFLRICILAVTAKILHRIDVRPFWYHRTEDQQAALYAIGRTVDTDKKPVTNCDGKIKISNHQKWLAVDLAIILDGVLIWERTEDYEKLGKLAKKFGLRWGGDWDADDERDPTDNDAYHFEYKGE